MTDDTTSQSDAGFSHLCQTVVSDVAAVIGKEPEDLQTPLYDVIDPEALEQIFHRPEKNPDNPSGNVVFEYVGCRVTVYSNGEVDVSLCEETPEGGSNVSPDVLHHPERDVLNM